MTLEKSFISQEEFGSVARCPRGCIHICVGNTSLRLSTKQYWELVDLLAESTPKIASLTASEHGIQEIKSSFKNQVARTVFVLCHLDGTDVMVDSNLNVFQPTRRSE